MKTLQKCDWIIFLCGMALSAFVLMRYARICALVLSVRIEHVIKINKCQASILIT